MRLREDKALWRILVDHGVAKTRQSALILIRDGYVKVHNYVSHDPNQLISLCVGTVIAVTVQNSIVCWRVYCYDAHMSRSRRKNKRFGLTRASSEKEDKHRQPSLALS